MTVVTNFPSIISLNVSGKNSPIENINRSNKFLKMDLEISCVEDIHFRFEETQTERERIEKKFILSQW